MKLFRFTGTSLFLVALTVLTANAQTPAASRPATANPTPAAGAQTGGALPEARIGIINTEAFFDQKNGILKLVSTMGTVDREFQPRRTELQGIKARYDALVEEITKTQSVAAPATIQQKADQAETLKREMERKQQDAQIAFEKRMREAMTPIQEDIAKSLEAFARGRGVTVLFDESKMGGAMLVLGDALDLTSAFVADYNRRNPAAAAATTPARP